jgi:hypothetical protein
MTDTAAKADPTKADPTKADVKAADETSHTKPATGTEKVATYRVTAPYVTLKSRDAVTGGEVVLSYFAGALVPETVDLEDLARHIRKGMVEKVEGADLKAVQKQKADEEKAEKAAEASEDKEGAEAVKAAQAEADTKAAAEKAAAKAKGGGS